MTQDADGFQPAPDVKGSPVSHEEALENIRQGAKVDIPLLRKSRIRKDGSLIFVAGGPTLLGKLDEVGTRLANGEHVMTSNFTHDFLVERGIIPSSCIVIDPTEQMADCIKLPQKTCTYYVGSVCTPGLPRKLKDCGLNVHRVLVGYGMEDEADIAEQERLYPEGESADYLVGGTMTPLRVMPFAIMLGYRKVEFYGFDSCYGAEPKTVYEDSPEYVAALERNGGVFFRDEERGKNYVIDEPAEGGFFYAYKKRRPENVVLTRTGDGREFLSSPGFTHQAKQFIKWVDRLDGRLEVVVHGDSLNSHLLKLHRDNDARKRREIGDRRWTDEYAALQRTMHVTAEYGIWGDRNLPLVGAGVFALYDSLRRPLTLMDYGAGSGALGAVVRRMFPVVKVTNYDPFHPKWRENPEPGVHDVVTCCDVMEHVESQCVENTLQYIADHCRYMAVFVIATEDAEKQLPDGRNAHITVRQAKWWLAKLSRHFVVTEARSNGAVLEAVCQKIGASLADERKAA